MALPKTAVKIATNVTTGAVIAIDPVTGIIYSGGVAINTPTGTLSLETNGTPNALQTLLNLIAGDNVTLTADEDGGVTIAAEGGGSPAGSQYEAQINDGDGGFGAVPSGSTGQVLTSNGSDSAPTFQAPLIFGTQVTLTADQMDALVETPQVLVAAVDGKVIVPVSQVLQFRYGSAPFGNLTGLNPANLALTYDGAPLSTTIIVQTLFGFLDQTSDQIEVAMAGMSPIFNLSDAQGKSLVVINVGGDLTGGDGGEVIFTLYYTLV